VEKKYSITFAQIFDKFGCTSAIKASFIAFGLRKFSQTE
jgi:hypothetical protein